MAWAEVWAFLGQQFANVFDIFFVKFTPIGAGISIGAFIFSITMIHKVIDLLVPFAGSGAPERPKPEKPSYSEQQHNNYWRFGGG